MLIISAHTLHAAVIPIHAGAGCAPSIIRIRVTGISEVIDFGSSRTPNVRHASSTRASTNKVNCYILSSLQDSVRCMFIVRYSKYDGKLLPVSAETVW
jgi:hypothetical protein